jgi:hypothetical protein
LPIPRALNRQQRAEYQNMLAAQAKPFDDRAKAVEDKVDELWGNSEAVDRIKNDIQVADGRVSKIFESELRRIAGAASPSMRRDLLASLGHKKSKPSRSAILSLRGKVRQDPFNRNLLEELRAMEDKAGGQTMVTYLDARIDSLKGVNR